MSELSIVVTTHSDVFKFKSRWEQIADCQQQEFLIYIILLVRIIRNMGLSIAYEHDCGFNSPHTIVSVANVFAKASMAFSIHKPRLVSYKDGCRVQHLSSKCSQPIYHELTVMRFCIHTCNYLTIIGLSQFVRKYSSKMKSGSIFWHKFHRTWQF